MDDTIWAIVMMISIGICMILYDSREHMQEYSYYPATSKGARNNLPTDLAENCQYQSIDDVDLYSRLFDSNPKIVIY